MCSLETRVVTNSQIKAFLSKMQWGLVIFKGVCLRMQLYDWICYIKIPQPPDHGLVPAWPVRNWATQLEVNDEQATTTIPLCPPVRGKIVFHETGPSCQKGMFTHRKIPTSSVELKLE
uniref:Uncharacterized protein n=1 Tax=Micrurus paraensis TaxID=1970185 RepID=A0A2D4KVW0_9SAUR